MIPAFFTHKTNHISFALDHESKHRYPTQSLEFSAICTHDFHECFFVVPGPTFVEQTNLAVVRWQSCGLDHSDVVFSDPVVLGLSVCACIGQSAVSPNTGKDPCGLVGRGGLVGLQGFARD